MASHLKTGTHDFVTVVKATRPSNKVVTVQNATIDGRPWKEYMAAHHWKGVE